jgi:hypothetical protein
MSATTVHVSLRLPMDVLVVIDSIAATQQRSRAWVVAEFIRKSTVSHIKKVSQGASSTEFDEPVYVPMDEVS